MRALPTDRMRLFVVAMHENAMRGEKTQAAAAAAAGYSGDHESLKQTGHRLAHDERIQAALIEEGTRRLGALVPIATGVLSEIISDPLASKTDRLRAIGMVMNRVGMHEKTEHNVTVKREYSQAEKVERAIRLSKSLGLDPVKVLASVGIHINPDVAPAAIAAPEEEVIDWTALPEEEAQ
jgi:hypothetical protein